MSDIVQGYNTGRLGKPTSPMTAASRGTLTTRVSVMAIALVMLLTALPVSAQGPRGRDRAGGLGGGNDPKWWGSAWGGYQWSNQVGDPGTQTIWNYDSNWSLRLTAEREIAPRTAIGLAWNYSRMPLFIAGGSAATVCRPACAAEGTIASYGVTVRSGGGLGLHLVYEGFLGATQFSKFTVEGDGTSAFSGVSNTDFAWSIGTGVGYGLSRDFQLLAIFDYGSSVHEKSNDLFQRRTTQHYTTRVGLRVGL